MIIGIGASENINKVLESIWSIGDRAQVVCYCPPDIEDVAGVTLVKGERPEDLLVNHLMEGVIDAAVRGTLPANATLKALRRASGVDRLERIALLETFDGRRFLFAPVGIDEGWTVPQKLGLIEKGRDIARRFGMNDSVAVLSGGRFGDIGRHGVVDRSLADAELLARLADAEHMEILIEDAVGRCGIIIAPDGITGNLIFRTLTLLGGGKGHGAPVVNISKIFVDTSRASVNYTNALLLAAALSER
jgi:putative methanogen marker protein 4